MRWLNHALVGIVAMLVLAGPAFSQPSLGRPNADAPMERTQHPQPVRPDQEPAPASPQPTPAPEKQKYGSFQQIVFQDGKKDDDSLKKQVELLQKQIETQQKMILLMQDQIKKPALGAPLERLEAIEARSVQAAQRDVELAAAVDRLTEQRDTDRRYPQLPAGLKELFLPSGNNETTLSIYGALAFGYGQMYGNALTAANGAGRPTPPGGFYFGEFTPDFLLKVNDWILLEAEIGIGGDGSVSAGSFAQADFFINDWLTIIGGRFVAPIGWFNERLNNPWINKLPGDAPGSGPLLWQQVLPPMAMLGVQAAGAFYICNSPFKVEYNVYVSNGLNLAPGTPGAPTIDELANLEGMTDTFNTSLNSKAVGGRLGLWWPEQGLAGGVSYMYNTDYISGFHDAISIWAVDLNYHKGNWDIRLEYGQTNQQATSFGFDNIRRQGVHGQVAYRARDLPNGFLQNLEFVYRYGWVDFNFDSANLTLASYNTPTDIPVRRQQNEFGINYWFTPRCVIKFALQINDEPGFHLHDNQFFTEFAWGW
jgi:hypothetical protein